MLVERRVRAGRLAPERGRGSGRASTSAPTAGSTPPSIDGLIRRWDMNDDGTLGDSDDITSITDSEGWPTRHDRPDLCPPTPPPTDLVAYVSHTQFYNDVTTSNHPDDLGDDFTGKGHAASAATTSRTSRTSCPACSRSIREPPDEPARVRPRRPALSWAGVRITRWARPTRRGASARSACSAARCWRSTWIRSRTTAMSSTCKPPTAGRTDPFAENAPVTVFAAGVRNNYDLVFHSNGSVYAPTNGSAAGGNTPAGPGNEPVGITNVTQTQNDYPLPRRRGRLLRPPQPRPATSSSSTAATPPAARTPPRSTSTPSAPIPRKTTRASPSTSARTNRPTVPSNTPAGRSTGRSDGKLIVTRWSGGDDLIVLDVADSGEITVVDARHQAASPASRRPARPSPNATTAASTSASTARRRSRCSPPRSRPRRQRRPRGEQVHLR